MKCNRYAGELSTPKMLWTMLTSPSFGIADLQWQMKGNNVDEVLRLQAPLIEDCFFNINLYDYGISYQVPMHYITGEFDVSTPVDLLKSYYELVEAPQKMLTTVENSGHLLFMENPVRAIDVILENMDILSLGFQYSQTATTGKKAYSRLSLLCDSLGLIGKEIIAIDSSKLRPNNSTDNYCTARKKSTTYIQQI
ncbi:MAG: alpha/beta hydrolase [Oscillospiraceae bacterium]